VDWYARGAPLRDDLLTAAVAWWAAFFANFAWRPALPVLPRLRSFQRRQFALTLRWAAQRFALPDPAWTIAMED
jgi:hypothetical protein